jgi:hypothetical protein
MLSQTWPDSMVVGGPSNAAVVLAGEQPGIAGGGPPCTNPVNVLGGGLGGVGCGVWGFGHGVVVWGGVGSAEARMAFERAKLLAKHCRLRKFNASALIRGGLALGLKRRADKGGCGGFSRPSDQLPSLRLPLTAEWAALALLAALIQGQGQGPCGQGQGQGLGQGQGEGQGQQGQGQGQQGHKVSKAKAKVSKAKAKAKGKGKGK